MHHALALFASSSLLLSACGGHSSADAGAPDASARDASPLDASPVDTGLGHDGGAAQESGPGPDAGSAAEGGVGPCGGSTLSVATLDAAHDALRAGMTDVALSDDGCVHLHRTVSGSTVHEEVTEDGQVTSRWDKTETTATGDRDDDWDGIFEWHAEVTTDGPDAHTMVITIDPTGSGHPVRRETYTQSGTDLHVLIEVDDGTGTLVTDQDFDTTTTQNGAVSGPTTGTGSNDCTPAQANELRMKMEQALAQGSDCSERMGLGDLAHHVASTIASLGIQLHCGPLPAGVCAQINEWDAISQLLRAGTLFGGPIDITVNPSMFFGDPNCMSNQLNILWHEILHTYIGLHTGYDPASAPETKTHDRVYACAAMCFDSTATKCQCASCLRTTVCDPRCASFADCTPHLGALCRCAANPRWYPTLTQCTVDCPSGLACFAADCQDVDYSCH